MGFGLGYSILNQLSTKACAQRTAAIAWTGWQCPLGVCSKRDRLLHPSSSRAGSSASFFGSFVSFMLFVVNSLRPPVLLRNRYPSPFPRVALSPSLRVPLFHVFTKEVPSVLSDGRHCDLNYGNHYARSVKMGR